MLFLEKYGTILRACRICGINRVLYAQCGGTKEEPLKGIAYHSEAKMDE